MARSNDIATERLVSRCLAARDGAPSAEVADRLKRHLLDTLGVTIGASAHADSSPAFADGVDRLAAGGKGEATLLPDGKARPAEHAALRNGIYAHSLDFDDTHRESSLHPGAPVIPAALAMAEREGATTSEFLAAVDAGYDIACALGRAVTPDAHYDRGFHITATCGTFGATAAAGVVAGLSAEEFENAFGLNGSQAAGSLQFLSNGAWNKRLHPGLAARRAVTAVTLSQAGVLGAQAPLEGDNGFFVGYTDEPNPAALDDLADRHAVLETGLKPYPCCRYMHPALDGLVDISNTVDAEDVEAVRIELPRSGVKLTGDPIDRKRRPDNFVDCQFSMPFGAAVALSEGTAGLEAFLDAQPRLNDPTLTRIMDVTTVEVTEAVQDPFPERWAARVVVTADGETHERFVDIARGEPENPLSWAAVEEKFDALATGAGLGPADRERAIRTVRQLEDHTISDLVTSMTTAIEAQADD
ncbi:MAG: MmgE/PrpD family protein [Halobacteriales archaeon]|nr:MmgE/PrpD family protein [Halobacteriales archaeon]